MQFLTTVECRSWCLRHPPLGQLALEAGPAQQRRSEIRFELPCDAGRRVALSRLLWNLVSLGQAEMLLWVQLWGVWPSCEHMPILTALRSSLGEARTLDEVPGHVFREGENEDAVSFLTVAILFLWDTWLLAGDGKRALLLSHDEDGFLCVIDQRDVAVVLRQFQEFGLPAKEQSR